MTAIQKQKVLFFSGFLALSFLLFPMQKVAAFSGSGAGTGGDPFQITSCVEFIEINSSLSSYYELQNALDCTSNGNSVIIGSFATPFTGNFNGGGYTITVAIDRTDWYTGLFSKLQAATVTDVRLAGSVAGGTYTGGIAGYSVGATTIARVANTATIYAAQTSGIPLFYAGILSFSTSDVGASLVDSYNEGDFRRKPGVSTNAGPVGGIAGQVGHMQVKRNYNRGNFYINVSGGLLAQIYFPDVDANNISDNFSVGSLANSANGSKGLLYWMANYGSGKFANNFYDQSRATISDCWNIGNTPAECAGVNSAWNDNDYFKSNSTNPPLNVWDFSTVWETVTDGYPALRSLVGDEHATLSDVAGPVGASTNFTNSHKGTRVATVDWVNAVTPYDVILKATFEYKKNTAEAWTVITTDDDYEFSQNKQQLHLMGLDVSTEYQVRVKVETAFGESPYSEVFTFSTTAPLPASAPADLTVTPQGNPLILDLEWTAPAESGDFPITDYLIQVKLADSTWEDLAITQRTGSTDLFFESLEGLRNDRVYELRVLASNTEAGLGAPSNVVTYATPESTVHLIKNCTDNNDEENFGLLAVDSNAAFIDDVFKLANDIDCEGVVFTSLRFLTAPWPFEGFYGVFDGQGFAINNLVVTENVDKMGLFAELSGAVIKHLTLEISFATADGSDMIGGIAGASQQGYNSINDVHVTIGSSFPDCAYVGGIIGEQDGGSEQSGIVITNSTVTGALSETVGNYGDDFGGLVGELTCDDIASDKKCGVFIGNTVEMDISGSWINGGLVGDVYLGGSNGLVVKDNTFSGTLNAANGDWEGENFGGLVGNLYISNALSSPATYTFSNNTVSGSADAEVAAGSFIGFYGNNSDYGGLVMDNNHSSMVLAGEEGVGGFVGYMDTSFWYNTGVPETFSNNSFTGSITGTADSDSYALGGFVGELYAYDVYFLKNFTTANVTNGEYIGGMFGDAEGLITVEDSYTTGNVTGSYYVGGMVGYFYGDDIQQSARIRNSYATGIVTADDTVGGIIGEADYYFGVSNVFFDGEVHALDEGYSQAGAIIGDTYDDTHVTFSNVTYNTFKNSDYSCVGQPGFPEDFTDCTGVNVENATPDYYKYNLTNAPMSSWNALTIWRKVPNEYPKLRWNVIDSSAPILTILGGTTVTIAHGASYVDAGATAVDDFDGNVTSEIEVTNPVNTSVAGTYYVLFDICDSDENCAIQQSRRVDVLAAPVQPTTTPQGTWSGEESTEEEVAEPKVVILRENNEYVAGNQVLYNFLEMDQVIAQVKGIDYTFDVVDFGDNYVYLVGGNGTRTLFEIGQVMKLDLDGDGKSDLEVILKGMENDRAEMSFQEVLGMQLEVSPTVTPTATRMPQKTEVVKNKLPLWVWALAIIPIGLIWTLVRTSSTKRN